MATIIAEQEEPRKVTAVYYRGVVSGSSYLDGLLALQQAYVDERCPQAHPIRLNEDRKGLLCAAVPLSIQENIRARVEEYETRFNADGSHRTEEERTYLFSLPLASRTGIAYKKESTKFKVNPDHPAMEVVNPLHIELEINLQPKLRVFQPEACIPIDYDKLRWPEFDSYGATAASPFMQGGFTERDAVDFPVWQMLVQDEALRRTYFRILLPLVERARDERLRELAEDGDCHTLNDITALDNQRGKAMDIGILLSSHKDQLQMASLSTPDIGGGIHANNWSLLSPVYFLLRKKEVQRPAKA